MQQIKTVASGYKPWNKDLPWYWVGLEGAVALVIGVYFIAAPDSANSTIRLLLALLLIIASAMDILTGFRNYGNALVEQPMTPYLLVRGGAGMTLGLMYFLATRSDYLAEDDARYILGYGLIAYAAIGLIAVIVSMLRGQMHWAAIGTNLLFLLLGAVLIYNNRETVDVEDSVRYLGLAATIGGGLMLAYTYFLKQRQEEEAAAGFATPAMAATVGTGIVPGGSISATSGEAGSSEPLATERVSTNLQSPMDSGTETVEIHTARDGDSETVSR